MTITHFHHQDLIQHGGAKRARGLGPEITAQPRPAYDDVGQDEGAESGLSIDPDDLGVRFLSGAIQQADFDTHRATERETELFESVSEDDLELESNDMTANTMWDHMLDLSLKSENGLKPVRDESDEVDAEIRQVLAELGESRARKAAMRAPEHAPIQQPVIAPTRATVTNAARDWLLVGVRSLRRVAERLRLIA